jgi:hypothetical protein
VFHALLGIAAFLRMRIRKSIDAADRTPFQPMGNDKQQTLESIVLDPRAEPEDVEMPIDEPELPEELATQVEPEEKEQRHV